MPLLYEYESLADSGHYGAENLPGGMRENIFPLALLKEGVRAGYVPDLAPRSLPGIRAVLFQQGGEIFSRLDGFQDVGYFPLTLRD